MARLLAGSDLDELHEVIERWVTQAPTARIRKRYEIFGHKLVELKQALAEAATQPTEQELELALTMMLNLATQHGPSGGR